MSTLGTGEHTAVAFADGLEIGRSTFSVKQLSTGNYLNGAEGLAIANNFPKSDQESWLWWEQSAQNFFIAAEQEATDPFDVAGVWSNYSGAVLVSITTSRIYSDRSEIYVTTTPVEPFGNAVGGVSEGYLRGKIARVFGVLPENIESEWTVTFTDPLNAMAQVVSCVSYDPRLSCLYNANDWVRLSKIAGPNTGRAAVQDGTRLAPINETLQVTPFGE
jgi:hypothetical protein